MKTYLSKSLQSPIAYPRGIRHAWESFGVTVNEFKEGTVYNRQSLFKGIDFMIVALRTNGTRTKYDKRINFPVGKGQYYEIEYTLTTSNIDVYITCPSFKGEYVRINAIHDGLLVDDPDDWKYNYGIVSLRNDWDGQWTIDEIYDLYKPRILKKKLLLL